MERPRSVGMAWYRAEDYARLREVVEDAARLPASFEAWRASAEQVEREVARSGVAVVRVTVEPEAFLAWCRHHDQAPNGAARSRYANEAAQRKGEATPDAG
ncbi:hypothetical protein [uncultured Methylobacterium sp.]|uniref:hypothetical protein n=1 Tax=uncultured Methylobacterium sp. TaxID=157278 RepID=UPI00262C264F|nr:hypothetical protein [uncultured Methylobacterium sp.]